MRMIPTTSYTCLLHMSDKYAIVHFSRSKHKRITIKKRIQCENTSCLTAPSSLLVPSCATTVSSVLDTLHNQRQDSHHRVAWQVDVASFLNQNIKQHGKVDDRKQHRCSCLNSHHITEPSLMACTSHTSSQTTCGICGLSLIVARAFSLELGLHSSRSLSVKNVSRSTGLVTRSGPEAGGVLACLAGFLRADMCADC
jgi:hypothetical protein